MIKCCTRDHGQSAIRHKLTCLLFMSSIKLCDNLSTAPLLIEYSIFMKINMDVKVQAVLPKFVLQSSVTILNFISYRLISSGSIVISTHLSGLLVFSVN